MNDGEAAIAPNWIVHPQRLRPAEDMEWLSAVLSNLFASASPPTAIMCGNDKMALRVVMQLMNRGIAIPDDLSIVGFDDFKVISENTAPPLTTASLPYFRMGQRAAELAIDLAGGEVPDALVERVHCDVIERGSHASLRTPKA